MRKIIIAAVMDTNNGRQDEANAIVEGAMLYINAHPFIHLMEIPVVTGQPLSSVDWSQINGILAWIGQDNRWILEVPKPKVNCTGDFPYEAMPVVSYRAEEILVSAVKQAARLKVREMVFLRERIDDGMLYKSWDHILTKLLKPLDIGYRMHEVPILPDINEQCQRLLFPAVAKEPAMAELLLGLRKPTLILTDSGIYGDFVSKLARQAGLAIPQDVAILVLGDTRLTRQADPALSVIPLPGQQVGFEAMKYLHAMLDGQALPQIVFLQPPPPILRASTDRVVEVPEISQALELIHLYACEGLTVNELAEHMELSRASLLRQFIRHYGKSPMQAIHEERIQRIHDWLDNTSLSCTRIAKNSGFRNAVAFGRFFKQQTGLTPNEYRHRKQGQG